MTTNTELVAALNTILDCYHLHARGGGNATVAARVPLNDAERLVADHIKTLSALPAAEAGDGWAILHEGRILVDTVSATRRGAIVKWLTTKNRVRVRYDWTDAVIERAWAIRMKARDATVRQIAVRPLQSPPPEEAL